MWKEITDPVERMKLRDAKLLWRKVGRAGQYKPSTEPWDSSELRQLQWDLVGYGSSLANTQFYILLEE